jgi:uncharacterized membrane protein HdeD (DUF308 family)
MCENDAVHGDRRRLSGARSWSERLRGLHLHLSLSRRAQFVSLFFLIGALALIPWTFFLVFSLPPRYDADHWRLLWTGFDASLIGVLLLAAWAAWYRRQILEAIAVVAGTLLLCDAWFDMVTSFGHRDEWLTLLTGFGVEVPLGIFFFWLYRRIAMSTMTVLIQDTDTSRPRRLRDFPIEDKETFSFEAGDGHDPSR